jgi:hypothetical protein
VLEFVVVLLEVSLLQPVLVVLTTTTTTSTTTSTTNDITGAHCSVDG